MIVSRKQVRLLSVIAAVIFIGINIFLIEKNNSKAERLNYVSEWRQITAGNLVESFPAEGIIVPSEEHPIFIDKNTEFSQFLVEKGDIVESGTPLFEYASDNLDQQIALLDAEVARLTASMNSIETYINDLVSMKYSLPASVGASSYYADTEESAAIEAWLEQNNAASIRELSLSLDQAVAEKELEKEKVEQDIEKYEDQRTAIESGRSGLTVLSPYAGVVENISLELDNPVITIVTDTPVLEGRLSEGQIAKVEEGMRADITSDGFDGHIIGEIIEVEDLPIDKPNIDKPSLYRFTANLGDHDKELYVGYHVQADIITAEAIGVPVVREKSTFKKDTYIWILNDEGIAEKRKIKPGLKVGKRVELKNGAEIGEFYVLDKDEVTSVGPFVTPFKLSKLEKSAWTRTSSRKMLKYILIGVLQR